MASVLVFQRGRNVLTRAIPQPQAVRGTITVPGDKSISHRALLFGAIAQGKTTIHNLSSSADVMSTLHCIRQLQVDVSEKKGVIEIAGAGRYGWKAAQHPFDCGNSGTTIRLLSGLLAAQPFSATLVGDESLSKRPMKRIIEPLTKMGASISSAPGGFPPLVIQGQQLDPITYSMPIASAQVKSCILFAGLYASGTTKVIEPYPSRDHTERMLQDFGVEVITEDRSVAITGPASLIGREVFVPGDISSAAFFIAAALLVPHSAVTIKNVCLNPTRIGLLEVLQRMGADISIREYSTPSSEPMGEIHVQTSPLSGVEILPDAIPSLIDEIPILAILATQANGKTILSGAQELRVKESDRLKSIATNLAAMGIRIDERADGFIIEGPQQLQGAVVDSFGDHRIAMAFSIAGLISNGATLVQDVDCVRISMPKFYKTLAGICKTGANY